MKKRYISPEMEILLLELSDIITTSGGGQLDEDELPPIIVG